MLLYFDTNGLDGKMRKKANVSGRAKIELELKFKWQKAGRKKI